MSLAADPSSFYRRLPFRHTERAFVRLLSFRLDVAFFCLCAALFLSTRTPARRVPVPSPASHTVMLFLFSPSRLRSEPVDLRPRFAAARLSQYCAFQRTGCCSTSVDGRRASSYASSKVSTAQGKGDEAEFEQVRNPFTGDLSEVTRSRRNGPQMKVHSQRSYVCTVQYACSLWCKAELAAGENMRIR